MDSTLRPVLILNCAYEPIAIYTVRRALKLLAKGKARLEEHHQQFVHRETLMPSVISLKHYHKVPRHKQVLSRKNVLVRDRHTCQYCGKTLAAAQLTLDHVLPESRGGESSWENLVAACYKCNHKKANRTPEEAGMTLLCPPRPLTIHTHRSLLRSAGAGFPHWRKYLYY